jgi:hypothetical protein
MCDEGITLDEISKAVKLQKPDKSPGEDGIVSEFYRHYWYLIGEDFESVVREIFDKKLLSESQNRGIITLMFKSGELNFFSKLFNKYAAESLSHPSEVKSFSKKFTRSSKIDTISSLYLPSLVLTLFHS